MEKIVLLNRFSNVNQEDKLSSTGVFSSGAANRYALALFELAKEGNELEKIEIAAKGAVDTSVEFVSEDPNFQRLWSY